jgi:hypothetical protein
MDGMEHDWEFNERLSVINFPYEKFTTETAVEGIIPTPPMLTTRFRALKSHLRCFFGSTGITINLGVSPPAL